MAFLIRVSKPRRPIDPYRKILYINPVYMDNIGPNNLIIGWVVRKMPL
jgi:hypothetical protein